MHNKSQIDSGNKVCDRQLRMSFKTERKKKMRMRWPNMERTNATLSNRCSEGGTLILDWSFQSRSMPWGTFKLKGLTPNKAKCQAKNTFLKSKNKNSYILFCDNLLTFHKKICRAYSIKFFLLNMSEFIMFTSYLTAINLKPFFIIYKIH